MARKSLLLPPPSRVEIKAPERLAIDMESMHRIHWDRKPYFKWGLCIAYATSPRKINYLETVDRRAGLWDLDALHELYEFFTSKEWVFIGHNVFYDLGLIQDTFRERLGSKYGLPHCSYQDSMHVWKRQGGIKNSLREVAKRQGVTQKQGGPNWDLVAQGDPGEWLTMQEYCKGDVRSSFELVQSFAEDGDPIPVRVWNPKKS